MCVFIYAYTYTCTFLIVAVFPIHLSVSVYVHTVYFFLGWGDVPRNQQETETPSWILQVLFSGELHGGESTHLSPMVDQRRETENWRETSLTGNVARSRGQGQCCHVACNKSTNAGGYINTREHTLARLCVHTIHIDIGIKHNTEYIVQAMNNAWILTYLHLPPPSRS